jgi:hypothetical protein
MARPRKPFAELSEGQRKRKLSFFRRHGNLSPSEVERGYNTGTLDQKGSRGHGKGTPEHPSEVKKNPAKYREYIARQSDRKPESPSINKQKQDQVYARLIEVFGGRDHNPDTIRAQVYGERDDSEFPAASGADVFGGSRGTRYPGMSDAELDITLASTDEQIVALARRQTKGRNPWWYH